MREYCTVQELLTVNTVFQAIVVAGWAGRNNKVFQVAAEHPDKLGGNLEGKVVLISAYDTGQTDIQKLLHGYCNLSAAAILLSGYTAALSQQVIDEADKNAVPLLICQQKLTATELQNVLEFTAESVQKGRISGYAEHCRLRQLADLKLELPGLLANLLQTEIRDIFPKITFSIGIGKQYLSVFDLCRSYQEAKHALDLGRFIQENNHITHFEDLGIIRLLSHISPDQLDDFYKEHLAVILEHDEKNDTKFLETRQMYFQQNGDLNLMAEKLFMHANTVRYRLKKIEELLDTDLQRIENRVNLSVACKIAKMRETNY